MGKAKEKPECKPFGTNLFPDTGSFRYEGKGYSIRWGVPPKVGTSRRQPSLNKYVVVIRAVSEDEALRVYEAISSANEVFGDTAVPSDSAYLVEVESHAPIRARSGNGWETYEKAVRLATWVLDHESRGAEYALHKLALSRRLCPADPYLRGVEDGDFVSIRFQVAKAMALMFAYAGLEELGLGPNLFTRKRGGPAHAGLVPATEVQTGLDAALEAYNILSEHRMVWVRGRVASRFDVGQKPKEKPEHRATSVVLDECMEIVAATQAVLGRLEAGKGAKGGEMVVIPRLSDLVEELRQSQPDKDRNLVLDYPSALVRAMVIRNELAAHAVVKPDEPVRLQHVDNVQTILSHVLAAGSGVWVHPPCLALEPHLP